MNSYKDYNDITVRAFGCHSRQQEIIDRKKDIMDKVSEYYNMGNGSILFVGFNPAMIAIKSNRLYVSEIDNDGLNCLNKFRVKYEYCANPDKKFDIVVTNDEYFTFTETEESQRLKIQQYCSLTGGCLITTLRDYKNLDFKVREYSEPAIIKNDDTVNIFSEIHHWDTQDRYNFETYNYYLTTNSAEMLGKFKRRTLFFKQLAKISSDSGSNNFVVHKNLMYKSLIKKNYEHVISMDFN